MRPRSWRIDVNLFSSPMPARFGYLDRLSQLNDDQTPDAWDELGRVESHVDALRHAAREYIRRINAVRTYRVVPSHLPPTLDPSRIVT
jgi:hypothetical protein